jgi:hypothetical protein
MRMISGAMSDYVFGVREKMEGGYERVEEHVWKNLREKSGFFNFPKAENISAVIVNAEGTLPKFNRMGYIAEFGDRRVRMVRTGAARGAGDPVPFRHSVHGRNHRRARSRIPSAFLGDGDNPRYVKSRDAAPFSILSAACLKTRSRRMRR